MLVLAGVAAGVSAANLNNNYDDAFITYRYSYNLASGLGFVYNPGERYLGTTTPLFGLLLGGLGFLFGVDHIPLISGILAAISLTFAGIALFQLGRCHGQPLCGFVAGLLFVCNSFLTLTFGGEILFQIALILWAFVTYKMEKMMWASILFAIALLTRMDSIFAILVVLADYIRVHRRFPKREALFAALVILPFAITAFVYYGSPLPTTLQARLAQRDSGFWGDFLQDMAFWLRYVTILGPSFSAKLNPISRFALCAVLGIPAVLLLYRFWILPGVWIGLFVAAYALFNVPFYHWYLVPVVTGALILAASAISALVEILSRLLKPRIGRYAVAIAILGLAPFVPGVYSEFQSAIRTNQSSPVELLYEKAGMWFQKNTSDSSTVAYLEIGMLGYYSHRRIIDPAGLVNPGVSNHLALRDQLWAYRHFRPDYILYTPRFGAWLNSMLQQEWFQRGYEKWTEISEPGTESLIVFRRVSIAAEQRR